MIASNTNNKPPVSVVVPIYNVEKYLDRCVQSILSQTYNNLEIILVDDGSPDHCGRMCDNYAKKDARVKVIHKDNGGLSDARNAAIDIATGEYILCIDSDDYVHHNLVMTLVESSQHNNADIAVAGYQNVLEGEGPVDLNRPMANTDIRALDAQDALEIMLYQKHVTNSAWGKLYRRSLFGTDIRYPKGKLCEDLATTYRLFGRAKKIAICSAKLYFYLQRPTSIINSPFKEDRADALKFAEEQLLFVKHNFPEIQKAAENRVFMEAVFITSAMTIADRKQYAPIWDACRCVFKKYQWRVLKDPEARLQQRIYGLAVALSPYLILPIEELKRILRSAL